MRGKNRKPIASCLKLPQFTTMNVIDGQAGLICYASLIFYSLTIDNILNIIVLLILAAVSIATLTGENGILSQADKAGTETKVKGEKEQIGLAYNAVMTANKGMEVTEDQLQTELQKYDRGAKVTTKEKNFKVKFPNGNVYILSKEDGTIQEPLTVGVGEYLVDKVEIGDYVYIDTATDYKVDYENSRPLSTDAYKWGYTTVTEALKGWRVLSKSGSGDTGTVQLISAGCPLTYYYVHAADVSKSISDLEDLTVDKTKVTSEPGNRRTGYIGSGFSNGLELSKVFNSNLIDKRKKVHAFGCASPYEDGFRTTKYYPLDEAETLYFTLTGDYQYFDGWFKKNYTAMRPGELKEVVEGKGKVWNEKWNDMFSIGQDYWLGGCSSSYSALWNLTEMCILSGRSDWPCGVRPVISLISGIKIANDNMGDGTSYENSWEMAE